MRGAAGFDLVVPGRVGFVRRVTVEAEFELRADVLVVADRAAVFDNLLMVPPDIDEAIVLPGPFHLHHEVVPAARGKTALLKKLFTGNIILVANDTVGEVDRKSTRLNSS